MPWVDSDSFIQALDFTVQSGNSDSDGKIVLSPLFRVLVGYMRMTPDEMFTGYKQGLEPYKVVVYASLALYRHRSRSPLLKVLLLALIGAAQSNISDRHLELASIDRKKRVAQAVLHHVHIKNDGLCYDGLLHTFSINEPYLVLQIEPDDRPTKLTTIRIDIHKWSADDPSISLEIVSKPTASFMKGDVLTGLENLIKYLPPTMPPPPPTPTPPAPAEPIKQERDWEELPLLGENDNNQ